jgi:hypothetical protein
MSLKDLKHLIMLAAVLVALLRSPDLGATALVLLLAKDAEII